MEKKTTTMSIEERALEWDKRCPKTDKIDGYIAGATEQQALSEADLHKYKSLYEELEANQEPLENRVTLAEARVKVLEELLKFAIACINKEEWPMFYEQLNKALNNQQQ